MKPADYAGDVRLAMVPILMAAILAGSILVFLVLGHWIGGDKIAGMDRSVLLLFRSVSDINDPLGPGWLEEAAAEITALGGYPVLIILVGTIFGYLIVARDYGVALLLLVSMALGTVVSQVLKIFYDRPRPDIVDHLVTIHTASFPSAHATMSAMVYLTLAVIVIYRVQMRCIQIYVLSVAIVLVILVGTSRIYLGVHWPSDVVAGWALGVAWASFSWLVISVSRRPGR